MKISKNKTQISSIKMQLNTGDEILFKFLNNKYLELIGIVVKL